MHLSSLFVSILYSRFYLSCFFFKFWYSTKKFHFYSFKFYDLIVAKFYWFYCRFFFQNSNYASTESWINWTNSIQSNSWYHLNHKTNPSWMGSTSQARIHYRTAAKISMVLALLKHSTLVSNGSISTTKTINYFTIYSICVFTVIDFNDSFAYCISLQKRHVLMFQRHGRAFHRWFYGILIEYL